MSKFISPYDREFEEIAEESNKAYKRGKQDTLKKIKLEIESLDHYTLQGEITPLVNVNRVLEIVNKYLK